MYGDEDPTSMKHDIADEKLVSDPRSYLSKTPLEKIYIAAAGVFLNIVLAVVIFIVYLSLSNNIVAMQEIGDFQFVGAKTYPNVLQLTQDFENEESGIILSINNHVIESREALVDILEDNYGDSVRVSLLNQDDQISERQVVLNGDGIKSNFDLDLFPGDEKVKTGEGEEINYTTRLVLYDYQDDSLFARSAQEASYEKGFLAGAIWYKIGDQQIYTADQLNSILRNNLGKEIEIEFINDSAEKIELSVKLPESVAEDEVILGVSNVESNLGFIEDMMIVEYSDSFFGGFVHTFNVVVYNGYSLAYLVGDAFKGKPEGLVNNVGGVVAIGGQVGQVVEASKEIGPSVLKELLNLMGVVSAVLGFMNILPIPLFDGGQIMFILIEKLRGKPMSERLTNIIYTIFLVLIILLGVVVTLKDIIQAL
jgi:RIP metalloprotease RseP